MNIPDYTLPAGHVLILRTCAADMTSHNGFTWPRSGNIAAPDWEPTAECGHGLHGWLWGQGNFELANKDHDAVWLVVEVKKSSIINLTAKVKFPKGRVLFAGFWWDAMAMVRRYRPKITKLEAFNTGDSGHAAATGDCGHAAATGYCGHAAATGNFGHAAATGDCGYAAATGDSGYAAATGDCGYAAATGYYGHAAATGDCGHAAATGNSGHAAATGDSGHAAATGNCGHAAATGYCGIACALGKNAVVKAGENGALIAAYWCDEAKRFRIVVAYVGENGIEANSDYQICDGKLVPVEHSRD